MSTTAAVAWITPMTCLTIFMSFLLIFLETNKYNWRKIEHPGPKIGDHETNITLVIRKKQQGMYLNWRKRKVRRRGEINCPYVALRFVYIHREFRRNSSPGNSSRSGDGDTGISIAFHASQSAKIGKEGTSHGEGYKTEVL